MKTQSAKGHLKYRPYELVRDKHGTSRRKYSRVCSECLKEDFVLSTTILRSTVLRCAPCARKVSPTPETRKKISGTLRSKYTDPSYKERMKVIQLATVKSGAEHWNWKGGVTPDNQKERSSEEAHFWRKEVFRRDLYHCRVCKTNTQLHAHHILSWASHVEQRFDVNNGIALCETCHDIVHKYLEEVKNNVHYAVEKSERTKSPEVDSISNPEAIPRAYFQGRKVNVDGGFGDGYFTESDSFDPAATFGGVQKSGKA